MRRSARYFFTVLAVICCLAAPLSAEQPEQGTLEVRIKDHRDAIDDFATVIITFDKIAISPKAGLRFWQSGWKEFQPAPAQLDLTRYTGKKTERVLRAGVDGGSFDGFHLKIKSIDGVLKKTRRQAPIKNSIAPVKATFGIPSRGETLLILDLTVMDLSDHPPRGYELSIKGYEIYTDGKLVDKVPPG